MEIVERLTILLSCIDKDDEEMRGVWETVEDAADEIRRLQSALLQQSTDNIGLHHDLARANETIERVREECNLLREQCNLLRKHCDRMSSLAIDNAKDTERAMLYRELLQKWLGNCFVDVYGHGVTFGMGVRKVWAETRDALKEGE